MRIFQKISKCCKYLISNAQQSVTIADTIGLISEREK